VAGALTILHSRWGPRLERSSSVESVSTEEEKEKRKNCKTCGGKTQGTRIRKKKKKERKNRREDEEGQWRGIMAGGTMVGRMEGHLWKKSFHLSE